YGFLIVDRRMAQALPWIGYYLTVGEPLSHRRAHPPPRAAIERYEHLPWAIKIYQTDHLEIYRLDYAALSLIWASRGAAPVHAGGSRPASPPPPGGATACCRPVVPLAGADRASPPRIYPEAAHG